MKRTINEIHNYITTYKNHITSHNLYDLYNNIDNITLDELIDYVDNNISQEQYMLNALQNAAYEDFYAQPQQLTEVAPVAQLAPIEKDLKQIADNNYNLFRSMKFELDGNSYQNIIPTTRATKGKHKVILYSDAKAGTGRFGITDISGNPLWHGDFTEGDKKNGAKDQSRGELCAAGKAVFLANKIKEAANLDTLHLTLYIDAKWLIYISKPTQKGHYLTYLAQRYGITIEVHWIPGVKNPADKWTIAKTFKEWQDNDLKSLIINP